MKFVISSALFWLVQLPMILLSFIAVPVMLLAGWDGYSTWFGNKKYGPGDTHYKAPSNGEFWKRVQFLCIRNPVSNFGKGVLSVRADRDVWLLEPSLGFGWKFLYGWKNPVDGRRSFVYRPWRPKS